MTPEILFLKQEDVLNAGLMDMDGVLEMVEKAYLMFAEREIKNPPKTMISLDSDEGVWKSRFMSMPVYIGGDINRAGIKWAAESTLNQKTGLLPMGIDMVVLSDPDTVLPVAIMDGTLVTAMRTGASTAVAAKYLAKPDAKTAGCIGAGIIGRTTIWALSRVLDQLEKVKLFDLNTKKSQELLEEFKGKVNVEIVGSVEAAVKDTDIVVTMTTSQKPFVKKEWVNRARLFLQVGSFEAHEEIPAGADRIVVDDWEPIKHDPFSVFQPLIKRGKLRDEDVTPLYNIISKKSPGREGDEFIFFKSRGMGCLDIMVADYIYRRAKDLGIGSVIHLWDNPKWV